MFMDWKTHIVNIAIPYKLIHKFNTTPIKIQHHFFRGIDKLIQQFKRKFKGPIQLEQF